MDDGSVDGSADIAAEFGAPVRGVRRPRLGAGAARNHGVWIRRRGDLIAFLDADDLVVPDRLARQLERFATQPGLQLCDGWARNFWSPDVPEAERHGAPQEVHTHGDAPKPGLIITWLVRHALLEVVGGFDEGRTLGEDSEWRDRADRIGAPSVTVDAVLAWRRLHAGNLTRTHYDEYLREVVHRTRRRVHQARSNDGRACSASCVVPVHNGSRWVADAIRSALDQSAPPREVIVVDDGSRDDTASVIESFGERVVHLRQDHLGVAVAGTTGVAQAGGDLLAFLDADDLWHPDRLRLQMELLDAHPGIGLADAHTRCFWSDDLSEAEVHADPQWAGAFWRTPAAGHISTWLVRRDAFDSVGGFDESLQYSEDTDWLLRYRDAGGQSVTHPEVLSHRRLHLANMTASDRRGKSRDLVRVVHRSRQRRSAVDG